MQGAGNLQEITSRTRINETKGTNESMATTKTSTIGWLLGGALAGLTALVAIVSRSGDEDPPPTERNPSAAGKNEPWLRSEVVRIAGSQLGKGDAKPYLDDAYGPGWSKGISWCGIFALWALRQVGLTSARWIAGKGFIYPLGLRQTYVPEMGDIAYFDKLQHQAIVAAVNSDGTVTLINGNGEGGRVTESRVAKSKVTAFYSIDSLIAEALSK